MRKPLSANQLIQLIIEEYGEDMNSLVRLNNELVCAELVKGGHLFEREEDLDSSEECYLDGVGLSSDLENEEEENEEDCWSEVNNYIPSSQSDCGCFQTQTDEWYKCQTNKGNGSPKSEW